MIGVVKGLLYESFGNTIVIETPNLCYEIHVCKASDWEYNTSYHVITRQVVREDSFELYGFRDYDQRSMFDALIKVPKIGASTAMRVINAFVDSESFYNTINDENYKAFSEIKGIGEKTALGIIKKLKK